MIERNPWLKPFWNVTRQGQYLKENGLAKAREAAAAAGLDPDQFGLGLREEKPSPSGPTNLIEVFDKTNEEIEEIIKNHKPGDSRSMLDFSGYMNRKRALRSIHPFAELRDAAIPR